jgi:UDP-N-acetylglucosamine 2-epimerase (non-hydrolysing)
MNIRKLKVATVVGTRPEIIRLSRVLAKLDQHCEHVLIHTGQNYDYELNEIFFEDLGVRKPDYFLEAAGSTGAETIGKVIIAVDQVLGEICPDALLVLGVTYSCLSVIPAKRRKIPVFHMVAGNRFFDMRVPA